MICPMSTMHRPFERVAVPHPQVKETAGRYEHGVFGGTAGKQSADVKQEQRRYGKFYLRKQQLMSEEVQAGMSSTKLKRKTKKSVTRESAQTFDPLLPARAAGVVSEKAGPNMQKIGGIMTDEAVPDHHMKKMYRDFIHGSNTDKLVFNRDIDGNRDESEDPRDLKGAAGNRASSNIHWEDQKWSDEHRITMDDIAKSSFAPRRMKEVPTVKTQVDEIMAHKEPDPADTSVYDESNPMYAGAAGATSATAALIAQKQYDPTMKPRRTNRIGYNSMVDKVVFGMDLDNSEADDAFEAELYSGAGNRSHSIVDPNDVSKRTTSVITDAKMYGEAKVVSTGGSGLEPTPPQDPRDFEGAAGRSTLDHATRMNAERFVEYRDARAVPYLAKGSDAPPKMVAARRRYADQPGVVHPAEADRLVLGANIDGSHEGPDYRFGPGAAFEDAAGARSGTSKREVENMKSNIESTASRRKLETPQADQSMDQLMYPERPNPELVVAEPRGFSRPFDGGGYAAGIDAVYHSEKVAANTRNTLIDGKVDHHNRRPSLVVQKQFDLINGEKSDHIQQLSDHPVFQDKAGKRTSAIKLQEHENNSIRIHPLDLIKDPFTHKGAEPIDARKQQEYSKLYGSTVKDVVFPQSSGLSAPPISEGFSPDVAGLTSETIHVIRGNGDPTERWDATPNGPMEEVYAEVGRAGKRGGLLDHFFVSRKAMVPAESMTADKSGASAQALIAMKREPPSTSPEARGLGSRAQGKRTMVLDTAFDGAGGSSSAGIKKGIEYRMHTGATPITRPNPVYSSDIDEVVFSQDTDGSPLGYFDGKQMRSYEGAGVPCRDMRRPKINPGMKGKVVSEGYFNASSVDVDSNVDHLTGYDASPDSVSGLMYEAMEDANLGHKAVNLTTELAYRNCAGTSSASQALTKILGKTDSRMHFPPSVLPGGELKGADSAEGVAAVVFSEEVKTDPHGQRGSVAGLGGSQSDFERAFTAGKSSGQLNDTWDRRKGQRGFRPRGSLVLGRLTKTTQREARLEANRGLPPDLAGMSSDDRGVIDGMRHEVAPHVVKKVPHSLGSMGQAIYGSDGQSGVAERSANEEFGRFVSEMKGVGTAGDKSDHNARVKNAFESHLESPASARAKRGPLFSRFRHAAGNKLSLASTDLHRNTLMLNGGEIERAAAQSRSAPSSSRNSQRTDRSRGTPRRGRRTPRADGSAGKATGVKRTPRANRSRRGEDGDGGGVAAAMRGWFAGAVARGRRDSRDGMSPRRPSRQLAAAPLRGGEAGVLALKAARESPAPSSRGTENGGGGAYERALDAGRSMLGTGSYTSSEWRGPLDGASAAMPTQMPGVAGGVAYGGSIGANEVDRARQAGRQSYVALTKARMDVTAAGGYRKEDLSRAGFDRSAGFGKQGLREAFRRAPPPFGVDADNERSTASRFMTTTKDVGGIGSHPWLRGATSAGGGDCRVSVGAVNASSSSSGFRPLGAASASTAMVPYRAARHQF